MAGRRTKLTTSALEAVVSFVRIGAYFETACAAAGIHRSVFYDWLKRGRAEWIRLEQHGGRPRKSEALYLQFLTAVKQAAAEAELTDLDRIDKASEQQWQAAAWKLERRYPTRYALRKPEMAMTVQGGVLVVGAPAATADDWAKKYAKAG